MINEIMTDIKNPASRSKNMAAIKNRNTKPELFVRKALFADGFRYRITPTDIPGHPDIYLPKYNIAIFIHGCFWHRHSGCRFAYSPKSNSEFWENKFKRNVLRDSEVRACLRAKGIRYLIVWECAIKASQKRTGNIRDFLHHIEEIIRSEVMEAEVEANEDFKTWWNNPDCF